MIEIVKEGSSGYRFLVRNHAGTQLFKSVSYKEKAKIDPVIKSLPPLLKKEGIVERRTNHRGFFLFSLRDSSGKIIGHSTTYESEAGMENAIANFYKLLES